MVAAGVGLPNKGLTVLAERLAKRLKVPLISIEGMLETAKDVSHRDFDEHLSDAIKNMGSLPPSVAPSPAPEGGAQEGEVQAEATEEPAAAEEPAESQQEVSKSACGWVSSKPVFEPSKEHKKESKLEKMKAHPDLLERLMRHTLGSQVCRNLGYVMTCGLDVAEAELIFRDIPPPPAEPIDGEEPPPEGQTGPPTGLDGRVDGLHLPETVVVVQGAEALKQDYLPPVAQFILDSDTASARNQLAVRVSAVEVTDQALGSACIEGVVQKVGRVRHSGFDKGEKEGLERLDPRLVTAPKEEKTLADGKDGDEAPVSFEELQRQEQLAKLMKEIQKAAEALDPDVKDELQEQNASATQPARAYALQYAMPALHRAMCMAGRLRPDDPVDFVSNFLMHYDDLKDSLPEPGKVDLPAIGSKKAATSK